MTLPTHQSSDAFQPQTEKERKMQSAYVSLCLVSPGSHLPFVASSDHVEKHFLTDTLMWNIHVPSSLGENSTKIESGHRSLYNVKPFEVTDESNLKWLTANEARGVGKRLDGIYGLKDFFADYLPMARIEDFKTYASSYSKQKDTKIIVRWYINRLKETTKTATEEFYNGPHIDVFKVSKGETYIKHEPTDIFEADITNGESLLDAIKTQIFRKGLHIPVNSIMLDTEYDETLRDLQVTLDTTNTKRNAEHAHLENLCNNPHLNPIMIPNPDYVPFKGSAFYDEADYTNHKRLHPNNSQNIPNPNYTDTSHYMNLKTVENGKIKNLDMWELDEYKKVFYDRRDIRGAISKKHVMIESVSIKVKSIKLKLDRLKKTSPLFNGTLIMRDGTPITLSNKVGSHEIEPVRAIAAYEAGKTYKVR